MRSNGARMAMVVIASVLTTGIAAGQQYQPSASLLRYPLPQPPAAYYSAQPVQHPYAVAQMPAAMPAPAYNQAANYGPSYYYASPAAVPTFAAPPPGSYANQVYPPTYAAQQVQTVPTYGGWPSSTVSAPAVPDYSAPVAQAPAYPVYSAAALPRYTNVQGPRSILVQSTAPAEPVPPQPYAEPSPSDSNYAQPPAAPYYYADPRQTAPAYPQTDAPQLPPPNCGPAYPATGGWVMDSPYQAGAPYEAYGGYGGWAVTRHRVQRFVRRPSGLPVCTACICRTTTRTTTGSRTMTLGNPSN